MTDRRARGPERSGLRAAGDRLSLRFANTVAWRGKEHPEERLPTPQDLLDWCVGAGLLRPDHAREIRARWRERPAEAAAFHRKSVDLREAMYRLFRSAILSKRPQDADLRLLNAALAQAPPRVRIVPADGHFGWFVKSTRAATSRMLAPIVWSAADLIAGSELHRLRLCANERCGWLFLDESRAGNRRWCSMEECGNQAKARRHYLRTKRVPSAENPSKDAP